MSEIIKIKNSGYSKYEEVLLRRDFIRKEAFSWQIKYMATFGDTITTVFKNKIECIKKKKMLSYYQKALNKGERINQKDMQKLIAKEMLEYDKQLKEMIDENDRARNLKPISYSRLEKIKKLYHKLVKQLHPDINPKTNENPELKNLWNMIVVSYNANDLKELEEAEVLVNRLLNELELKNIELEIPNLAEKIEKIKEEILEIKSRIPYQYKYLLQDSDAIAKKEEELAKELKEYEDYERELDEILKQIVEKGGFSLPCQMI